MKRAVGDPEKAMNLRVTPEVKKRLEKLVGRVSTGATRMTRDGLAVWCLARGLLEAERDPGLVLRSPDAIPSGERSAVPSSGPDSLGSPSAPTGPREAPEVLDMDPSAIDSGYLRARLAGVRAKSHGELTWAEIGARTGLAPSVIERFERGTRKLKGSDLVLLEREVWAIEKAQGLSWTITAATEEGLRAAAEHPEVYERLARRRRAMGWDRFADDDS